MLQITTTDIKCGHPECLQHSYAEYKLKDKLMLTYKIQEHAFGIYVTALYITLFKCNHL